MNIEAARRWLAAVEPAPPESLRERMTAALDAVGGGVETTPGSAPAGAGPASGAASASAVAPPLATAALEHLRVVLAAEGGRDTALDLLAVDALLTYAFEAAAEAGPEAFETMTSAYGPAGLARGLLEST